MISVVVPAHDGADRIGACLASIRRAAEHALLRNESVRLFVALDACKDRTGYIAHCHGAALVVLEQNNVGAARALGARAAIAAGARWLAFTDADTQVAPDWLAAQLALSAEAVCGTVTVIDWGRPLAGARERHQATHTHRDGHRHVHGANLGVSTEAYLRAGGFDALVCNEDLALVEALHDAGVAIAWSMRPKVFAGARRDFNAPDGFCAPPERIDRDMDAAARLPPGSPAAPATSWQTMSRG
jgi:glycosyltransferase involved in cell wall biosynthesis